MKIKDFLYTNKKPYKQILVIDSSGSMMTGSILTKEEEIKIKNETRNKKLKSL
ncbi:hypothetical protein M0Q50_09295 [bacterium]|jgi:hypothetical protein|nr:hypothetical protein [bacterium]